MVAVCTPNCLHMCDVPSCVKCLSPACLCEFVTEFVLPLRLSSKWTMLLPTPRLTTINTRNNFVTYCLWQTRCVNLIVLGTFRVAFLILIRRAIHERNLFLLERGSGNKIQMYVWFTNAHIGQTHSENFCNEICGERARKSSVHKQCTIPHVCHIYEFHVTARTFSLGFGENDMRIRFAQRTPNAVVAFALPIKYQ